MDIKKLVEEWIETGNCYDTKKYLSFYCQDAILDDPSVGSTFTGYQGIETYFKTYFIGYQTQTKLIKLDIYDCEHAHLEVAFSGVFPEGKICGTFDFTFKDEKIAFVKADLCS
jgi:ketosteroid isomerase-like protein